MKNIHLKAYGKINLSLDVCGLTDDGFHLVEMVMQQILLCDEVDLKWKETEEPFTIQLKTNKAFLPTDEKNLAYKAALLMKEVKGAPQSGSLEINIKKRIPVAAGLAGGSSNGAAVIHGLNQLWGLNLSVKELCETGAALGSDVPFCIMGQAAENPNLKDFFEGDSLACHCALATGTGTDLKPVKGLKSHLVLTKPPISVSTAEVYKGIDNEVIPERPDTEKLLSALEKNDRETLVKNMINVLENYTLKRYSIVNYSKEKMRSLCGKNGVLMSGSGPTVFGLCDSVSRAQEICEIMQEENRESFWTRTTY